MRKAVSLTIVKYFWKVLDIIQRNLSVSIVEKCKSLEGYCHFNKDESYYAPLFKGTFRFALVCPKNFMTKVEASVSYGHINFLVLYDPRRQ